MRWIGLVALAAVAGCSDPALSAGLRLTEEGLEVRPAASAGLGGLRLTVTP
jgi:hypothetical protein